MKSFIIEEKFTGYANIRIEAETEDEALALYNRGQYKDSEYDMDDMFYDYDVSDFTDEHTLLGIREETQEVAS